MPDRIIVQRWRKTRQTGKASFIPNPTSAFNYASTFPKHAKSVSYTPGWADENDKMRKRTRHIAALWESRSADGAPETKSAGFNND